jgi:hypothetical protein
MSHVASTLFNRQEQSLLFCFYLLSRALFKEMETGKLHTWKTSLVPQSAVKLQTTNIFTDD